MNQIANGPGAGRNVLITGAASGMGRAAAQRFASHGDRIILVDRNADLLEESRHDLPGGQSHLTIVMDIADRESVEAGFARATDEVGELDVAILAAGIVDYHGDGPLAEVTDEVWERQLAVNLRGAFLTAQASYAAIAKRSTSSIVLVASIAALIGQKKLYAYSAAKSGVASLARTLAMEAGKTGVRVNAISPGAVATNMTKDVLQYSKPLNVLGRAGQPEEIAAVLHGICAPDASFLTGANIPIDGGAAIY
jgi:meso-butanediol dehydrogenase/(S,S)-butanediol dehydrogenase/diacetyl reductase